MPQWLHTQAVLVSVGFSFFSFFNALTPAVRSLTTFSRSFLFLGCGRRALHLPHHWCRASFTWPHILGEHCQYSSFGPCCCSLYNLASHAMGTAEPCGSGAKWLLVQDIAAAWPSSCLPRLAARVSPGGDVIAHDGVTRLQWPCLQKVSLVLALRAERYGQ